MKATRAFTIIRYLFFFFILTAFNTLQAQKNDKAARVGNLLESKNFVFRAQSMDPMRGINRQLTSEYDVRLLGDSLLSHLPYFGRAYVAPMNPAENALQFTSTRFDYVIEGRRKGGWDINIKPKDTRDVRQLFLTVSANGSASLQVLSNNREPISFYGYITEVGKR